MWATEPQPERPLDRRRDCDDIDVAVGEIGGRGRQRQALRRGQLLGRAFERAVDAVPEFGDPALVDVEAGRRPVTAEGDGERQSDIAETDDADAGILCVIHPDRSLQLVVVSWDPLFRAIPFCDRWRNI